MNRFVRIYLIPGTIMQSVMIGGGYGTGREVIEFFTHFGIWGGILSIGVATVCIAVVFSLSLEISRVFKVYDYRNFFKILLGRGWFLYEILVVILFMLVIAVIGAAAGTIVSDEFGLPSYLGIVIMLVAVVTINFFGRMFLTRVFALWSVILYIVFSAYLISVFVHFPLEIADAFSTSTIEPGWFVSGLQYSFYNVTAIPIILYAVRGIESRKEAFGAGTIGALIAVVPALMLHISFAVDYPEVLSTSLPVYHIFNGLNMEVLKLLYLLVLFGTFVETGAGNIQGFLERLDNWRQENNKSKLSRMVHSLIAIFAVGLAGGLSSLGIISLIAEGYGTIAWGFMIVYVIPLLTIGVYKILKANNQDSLI